MAEGAESGKGTFVFVDGSRYEGEWRLVNGARVRHGTGKYDDGAEVYVGEWKNDEMNGKGTYTFATGAVYEGEFANNQFEGQGVYRWTDKAVYEGQWRQGRMHGDGAYTDPEGVKWAGKYHNGKFFNGKAHVSLR